MSNNEFRETRLLFLPPRLTRKSIFAFFDNNNEELVGGREKSLAPGPESQVWPGLPGGSSPPELGSNSGWSSDSCWSRRRSLKFSLGEVDWPSLETPRGGGGGGAAGGVNNPGLLSGISPAPSYGPGGGAERVDILGIRGPTPPISTHEQPDDVPAGDSPDGAIASRRHSGGAQCKGWMRLPPIVMPSSSPGCSDSSPPNPTPLQQKRSRSHESPEEERARPARDGGASCCSEEPAELPPVYLMLNTDFIVISPLKENLLLTLALTQKRPASPPPSEDLDSIFLMPDSGSESESEVGSPGPDIIGSPDEADGKRLRRQVFVGRFEAFSSFVRFGLGRDAMRVVTEANAGGTSTISESLSVEYFVRRFRARDVVTEMEVEYCAMNWKKVDYICSLYDQRVGVSVTRAMSFPHKEDFSPQMAYRLLYKKLFGLVVARHGVTERHSFSQCILHVWCETTTTAKLLEDQYKQVSEELDITDDVIMVLTVADGDHARPIFYEKLLHQSP